jgi:NADP-dependent 3-hydroxy acid dehydrogenase YdfG
MKARHAVVTGAGSGIGTATVRRSRKGDGDVVAVAGRGDRLADGELRVSAG